MFLKFLNIYSSLRLRYSQKENCFIRMRETPIRHIGRGQLSNHYRGEKSLRHVAMVANFLDLNKPWSNNIAEKKTKRKMTYIPFLLITVLRNKTVAHTFLPSFENANGRLCQEPEILLTWSRDDLLFSISPLS